VWLFQDACYSCENATHVAQLADGFVKSGVLFLDQTEIQERVNGSRNYRKQALDLGLTVALDHDFVITITKDGQYDSVSLLKSAMTRCRVGGASVVVEQSGSIRISLRLSKIFQSSEGFDLDKYRLDLVANKLNGGGHRAASGARAQNIEIGLNELKLWADSLKLKLLIADFRS